MKHIPLYTCGVYTILNTLNNKVYVGYAQCVRKRLTWHRNLLRNNKHHSDRLQNSWNKYGEENFEFDILIECEKRFLASEEHYWATILNCHNEFFGFNILATHPENKIVFSKETKERMSKAQNIRFINKPISEETKKKISSGVYKTLKESVIKNVKSLGTRKRFTTKFKIILQYSLEGEFIREWSSILEATVFYKISGGIISQCCKGKRRSARGFIWKYK